MNAIQYFQWGGQKMNPIDLDRLHDELSANIYNLRFTATRIISGATEGGAMYFEIHGKINTVEAIIEKGITQGLLITFKILEDIDAEYDIFDFMFINKPYFYDQLGNTRWLFEGNDVGRYDKTNTTEYPYTLSTTINNNKNYSKNELITLKIVKK